MIWLLLDRTVPVALRMALEGEGVRAIHAGEEELATADARRLLESAIEDECLLVTRNYGDFTRLAEAFRHAGRSFPGIVFLPPDPARPAECAAAIREWLEAGGAREARDTCAWLTEEGDLAPPPAPGLA